jgi:starch-binding outer membrane protein, SusD/RagB family
MKKFSYKYLLIFLLVLTLGCRDFLEEESFGILTEESFWKNEDDAEISIISVYSCFISNNYKDVNWAILSTLTAPEFETSGDPGPHEELDEFIYTTDNSHITNFWIQAYKVINQANVCIEKIQGIPNEKFTKRTKEQYIAEAKFLRALAYFDLVRAFNRIPYITKPYEEYSGELADYYIAQTEPETVYAGIISDLEEAEKLLPSIGKLKDRGRASKEAAIGLQAKVYLAWAGFPVKDQSKYSLARNKAEQLINIADGEGNISLLNDYHELFPPHTNDEIIFLFQFSAGPEKSYSSELVSAFMVGGFEYPDNHMSKTSRILGTPDFREQYPPSYRKQIAIPDSFKTYPSDIQYHEVVRPMTFKYYEWDQVRIDGGGYESDWIELRFADILLIYAEAHAMSSGAPTQEAVNAMNRVRERAVSLQPNDVAVFPPLNLADYASAEQFRDTVLKERLYELCFEGHRRWDLVRTEKLVDANIGIKEFVDQKHNLYPIPRIEIQKNIELKQNPGY